MTFALVYNLNNHSIDCHTARIFAYLIIIIEAISICANAIVQHVTILYIYKVVFFFFSSPWMEYHVDLSQLNVHVVRQLRFCLHHSRLLFRLIWNVEWNGNGKTTEWHIIKYFLSQYIQTAQYQMQHFDIVYI